MSRGPADRGAILRKLSLGPDAKRRPNSPPGFRCAGAPWRLLRTPDYRDCLRCLGKTLADTDVPAP